MHPHLYPRVLMTALMAVFLVIPSMNVVWAEPPAAASQPTETDQAALAHAIAEAQKSNFSGALQELDVLISARPDWTTLRLWRGKILVTTRDLERAVEDFNVVLSKNPADPDALLLLAGVQSQGDDPTIAIATLDKLLAAHPSNGEASVLRIQQLIAVHRNDEAAKSAIELLTRVKGEVRPSVLARIVPLQLLAGDYASAEAGATELLKGVQNPELYAARAEARRGLKKFDDAKADLQAGIAVMGGQPAPSLMFVSSQVMFDTGNFAAAIGQLADVLELLPGDRRAEQAMARAVVASVAAYKNSGHDLQPAPGEEELKRMRPQWKFRAIIGNERIKRLKTTATKAMVAKDMTTAGTAADQATLRYPDAEMYRVSALSTALPLLVGQTDLQAPQIEAAITRAIEKFQIAAGLFAVEQTRDPGSGSAIISPPSGNLMWADLLVRRRDDTLAPADHQLLKGFAAAEKYDYLTALRAYEASDPNINWIGSSPAHTLRDRMEADPEQFQSLLTAFSAEIDNAILGKDLNLAMKLAEEMQHTNNQGPPEAYALQARIHRLRGERAAAEKALESAQIKTSLCTEGYLLNAADLLAAGKTEQAMLAYNIAALGHEQSFDGNEPGVARAIEARNKLEKAYAPADLRMVYSKTADAAMKSDGLEDQVALYAAANRLKFGFEAPSAVVFDFAGSAASQLGLTRDAIGNYWKAGDLDPKNTRWASLAALYSKVGSTDLAISALTHVIDSGPDQFAFWERANIYADLGDLTKAAQDLKQATVLGRKDAATLLMLGECIEATAPEDAKKVYEKVIVTPPDPNEMFAPPYVEMAKARLYILPHPSPPP